MPNYAITSQIKRTQKKSGKYSKKKNHLIRIPPNTSNYSDRSHIPRLRITTKTRPASTPPRQTQHTHPPQPDRHFDEWKGRTRRTQAVIKSLVIFARRLQLGAAECQTLCWTLSRFAHEHLTSVRLVIICHGGYGVCVAGSYHGRGIIGSCGVVLWVFEVGAFSEVPEAPQRCVRLGLLI